MRLVCIYERLIWIINSSSCTSSTTTPSLLRNLSPGWMLMELLSQVALRRNVFFKELFSVNIHHTSTSLQSFWLSLGKWGSIPGKGDLMTWMLHDPIIIPNARGESRDNSTSSPTQPSLSQYQEIINRCCAKCFGDTGFLLFFLFFRNK